MRRGPVVLAIAVIALAAFLAAGLFWPPREVATPSPSPTAFPTTSPGPVASPSSSPSPSPAAQGLYMSKKLGFALELPGR